MIGFLVQTRFLGLFRWVVICSESDQQGQHFWDARCASNKSRFFWQRSAIYLASLKQFPILIEHQQFFRRVQSILSIERSSSSLSAASDIPNSKTGQCHCLGCLESTLRKAVSARLCESFAVSLITYCKALSKSRVGKTNDCWTRTTSSGDNKINLLVFQHCASGGIFSSAWSVTRS